MDSERVETSLRFVGDWPWWAGLCLAALLAAATWWLYRRELGSTRLWLRWLLPVLRASSVVMIVFMLTGPVLHHRKTIGQLSRLLIFIDGSRSMELTDPAMSAARKLLILAKLNLLSADVIPMDLPRAIEALAQAQSLADQAAAAAGVSTEQATRLAADFSSRIEAARSLLEKHGGGGGEQLSRFEKELSGPAKELTARELKQADERARASQDFTRLGSVAARSHEELSAAFEKLVNQLSAIENSPVRAALQKFDTLPRWQRVQAMLLEGEGERLLGALAKKHDVQLIELTGGEARDVWRPTARDSALPASMPPPDGELTDLGIGLKATVAAAGAEQRSAAVLITDGQHNHGESPVEIARLHAGRETPIFAVGIGSKTAPRDVAVIAVEHPEAVFYQDRVRGQITLKEDLPPGIAFTVSVKAGDKTLWQQQLATEGKPLRKVPFDFAIQGTIEAKLALRNDTGVEASGVPLELTVLVSEVDGDGEPRNNQRGWRLRAVTQKRRILMVDGRPRWESRYMRNLFDRDEQWEVNAVFAGSRPGEPTLARGGQAEQFPTDSESVSTYDLIIIGDVPRTLWKDHELEWIRDFVAKRGGALVFIDGARGGLRGYANTALAPLLPVEWKGAGTRQGITRFLLPEHGRKLSPLALVPDDAQNANLWRQLQAPHWFSGAIPLAGAESLLDLEVSGRKEAAIVHRPFGAGRVLYHAFDDSWRWRYEVADQYHVKFWNQLANWIAEPPFAVRDKFVSLDAGAITYRPDESADIRARIRDGAGKPVTNAVVDAVLHRDGHQVATIRLTPDENAGGLYRGKSGTLEPGEYEVGIHSVAIAERDTRARTSFKVEPRETGELNLLTLNDELLRQIATISGGRYLQEENAAELPELLAPLSEGRIVESDTVLWQSYWWFLPIVLLLTIEWLIRKRVGLI